MNHPISPPSIKRYLINHDIIESDQTVYAENVGDSIVGNVIDIQVGSDSSYILKQSLDIGYNQPFDESRVHRAANTVRKLSEKSDCQNPKSINFPEPIYEDPDNNIVIFQRAPDNTINFRYTLKSYMITDIEFEDQIISKAAKGLSKIHDFKIEDDLSELTLTESTRQDAMRIDKHHKNIIEKYPRIAHRAEKSVESLLSYDQSLVHGDYSPKNILVDHQSDRLWVLDFEFTHVGSPIFDLTYFINYLFLVECVHGYHHKYSFELIMRFWEDYYNQSYQNISLENDIVLELPIRILTRLDGVHPITWIPPELKEEIRDFVDLIIQREINTIEEFIKLAREHFSE